MADEKADQSRSQLISENLIHFLALMVRPHVRSLVDTEDIVQEVLLKVVKSGGDVKPEAFLGWLRRVVHTTAIDFYRKNRNSTPALDPVDPVGEKEEGAPALSQCVQPLLERLGTVDREALLAVDLRGEAQTEVAKRLGLSYSTLKSRVQRAREKLKVEILTCCQVELDRRNHPIEARAISDKKSCC